MLDVGCAFGYGTAAVAAPGPRGRVVVGVERDPEHLERGGRASRGSRVLEGDATALPVADDVARTRSSCSTCSSTSPNPEPALAEAHRVLRPGGVLVLSVPHRGPLRRLDALNVYPALSAPPPLVAAARAGDGVGAAGAPPLRA